MVEVTNSLDVLEWYRDDVPLVHACDGLDNGRLAAARLAMEEQAKHVRDAALQVPGLIAAEELDSLHQVLILREEDIVKVLSAFKTELSVELKWCTRVGLLSVDLKTKYISPFSS